MEIQFEEIKYAKKLLLDQQWTQNVRNEENFWTQSVRDVIEKAIGSKLDVDEDVPEFPSALDFVNFAQLAYVSDKSSDTHKSCAEKLAEKQSKYGELQNWKLLTTAADGALTNGYFGAAFYHSSRKQVVIAHRGTVTETVKNIVQALTTDVYGLAKGKHVPQISSAVTFTLSLLRVLHKISEESGDRVHFEVFLTGHSLGGWLAQITCFAAKYLRLNRKSEIVTVDRASEGHDCHTVAFESPGCSAKLLRLQKLGLEYRKVVDKPYDVTKLDFSVRNLDIRTYLTEPTLINSPNAFAGSLYYLPEVSSGTGIRESIKSHSIDNVKKCVELWTNGSGELKQAIDWPKFKIRQFFKTGVIEIIGKKTLIQCEDTKCSKHIFSDDEQQFLLNYRYIRDTNLAERKFSVLSDFEQKRLGIYNIDRYFLSVDAGTWSINYFVPFVRLLLRLKPQLYEECERFICSRQDMKLKLYQIQSDRYIDDYIRNSSLNFDVERSTAIIFQNPIQVIQLIAPAPLVKVTEIYQTLERDGTFDFLVFNINYLSMASSMIKLSNLFDKDREFIFLIECTNRGEESGHIYAHKIFDEMGKMLDEKRSIKVILVTEKIDSPTNEINDIIEHYLQQAMRHRRQSDDADKFIWDRLDDQTKSYLKQLLSINFQGTEKISLSNLIEGSDRSVSDAEIFSKIDVHTILSLLNDNLIVGMDQRSFVNFDACCDTISCKIRKKNLVSLTSDERNDRFVIVGNEAALVAGLENSDSAHLKMAVAGEKIQFIFDQENPLAEFKQVCIDHPTENVYLVNKIDRDYIDVQEVYHPDFYLQREFDFPDKIVITGSCIPLELTVGLNAFVFRNATYEELEIILETDILQAVERGLIRLAANLDEDIELTQAKREKYTVHYVDVVNSNEGTKKLIWYRSRGPFLHTIRKCLSRKEMILKPLSEKFLTRSSNQMVDGEYINKKLKTMIIVDDPGMGKSTSLNSLCSQLKSDWVIRVKLKNCNCQTIATLEKDIIDTETAVKFFSFVDGVGFGNSLAKTLLALALDGKSSKKVYCLFDAFDEIRVVKEERSDYTLTKEPIDSHSNFEAKQKVIKLLKYLQSKANVYVWVTSRESDSLENGLSVLAIKFKRLDRQQQETFLTKQSLIRMDLECIKDPWILKKIEKRAERILQVADSVFGT